MTAVLRYAAFTTDPAGGNPAGVVLADGPLPADRMQATAAAVGYSETAFCWPSTDPGVTEIRYFAPAVEVTFCGHATIAAAVALAERDPSLVRVDFRTAHADVPVVVTRDGGRPTAALTSPPASHRVVDGDVLRQALACFGWDRSVLDPALAPVVADAGASHLVLPLARREDLATMRYGYEELEALMTAQGWTTVDVVWRESPTTVHARNPFPVGGVVEDPATGAAAAALGGYLRAIGAVDVPTEIVVHQGEDMGRPSLLVIDLRDEPGVRVRGTAVPIT